MALILRLRCTLLGLTIGLLVLGSPTGGAWARPVTELYTKAGKMALRVSNLGYLGTSFASEPSAVYPAPPNGDFSAWSGVEHLYSAGLWVGAVTLDGARHVTTGSQDASSLAAGEETREFGDIDTSNLGNLPPQYFTPDDTVAVWSTLQNSDFYYAGAIAEEQFELPFTDLVSLTASSHVPLGLKVNLHVLAWGQPARDDFVILQYDVINVSGSVLRDVYLGFWTDTTVGSTELTPPYDDPQEPRWNFYDDVNGAWGPQEWTPPGHTPDGDPDVWMMWERDQDGDEGLATSWWGARFLGVSAEPDPEDGVPPVSYNQWRFRGVPDRDDEYENPDLPGDILPGKYQLMGNGDFDVGETQEYDFTSASNWIGLLSTGPFRTFAPGDTLTIAFAACAGEDSLSLLGNSKVAQKTYDDLANVVSGPPSPRLEFAVRDNTVEISWEPGSPTDDQDAPLPLDDPRRSPEYHISDATGDLDFQGYRVFRLLGATAQGDFYEEAELVAQFDIVDGIGFDTGLPPVQDDGRRRFVDTNLWDGFPHTYAVVSYAAPNPAAGLEELQSGYRENAETIYPGPAPASADNPRRIGVYPNPYRASSMFDGRAIGDVREIQRRIWFTGLPARCRIQVFNLVGEVVATIEHDDPTTGQHAWNLLSDYDRVIASGLYIYVVEDLATGEIQRDKLVIIK